MVDSGYLFLDNMSPKIVMELTEIVAQRYLKTKKRKQRYSMSIV
jgi:hypothetical protein